MQRYLRWTLLLIQVLLYAGGRRAYHQRQLWLIGRGHVECS